jgi:prevent-host-death family protein
LIERARDGEEIIISVDSRPVVTLVPVRQVVGKRIFGSMRGRLSLSPEFFEPLPPIELAGWGD